MRIDHHAYQRATRVAGFGLMLQIAIGVMLLLFGLFSEDVAFQFASLYVLTGIPVWVGLIIIFHQHKLERLESLEEDELAATRAGAESMFERMGDESRVAARRLVTMHKWVMPILSIVVALLLGAFAAWLLRYMSHVWKDDGAFTRTDERGWAVAICLGWAAIAFIFSRFVAGMAKQPAWSNLRGGAAYMVGNALILVAVAAGTIFRFFRPDQPRDVIEYIGWAIPIFMILLACEIVLNFVLNLYRPRIPGEVPRPAFDSKILSLLSTPDSIVRSLNEAVNYQFGFDVSSSWGYQLLLRSIVSLVALGLAAMILMSMMVVVEPQQQAIRLRSGAIVDGRVYSSGIMWKWPWPLESAAVFEVTPIRTLYLTPRVVRPPDVNLWDQDEPPKTETPLDPFIVGASNAAVVRAAAASAGESAPEAGPTSAPAEHGQSAEDRAAEQVSDSYSLVDSVMVLQYRIRHDADGKGLLQYLNFAPDSIARGKYLTDRERALRDLALEQVSARLAELSLDDVLSPGRSGLAEDLRKRIQAAFDDSAHPTGVELVAVTMPMLRPSGNSAPKFENLGISVQASRQRLAEADHAVVRTYAYLIGKLSLTDEVLNGIDEYNRLRAAPGGRDAEATIKQRQKIESLLLEGGGFASQTIATAERDRWSNIMGKRAQASRVQSQLGAFRAAPRLYTQREIMNVFTKYLPKLDKYVIAVDPARIDVGVDLKKSNAILDFAGASKEELERKNNE